MHFLKHETTQTPPNRSDERFEFLENAPLALLIDEKVRNHKKAIEEKNNRLKSEIMLIYKKIDQINAFQN